MLNRTANLFLEYFREVLLTVMKFSDFFNLA